MLRRWPLIVNRAMFCSTRRMCKGWAAVVVALPLSLQATAPTSMSLFYHRDHAFGLSAPQLRYEYLLSETVFAGFPDTASLAFFELPSSGPERGVWMHPHGSGYLVVFARAKSNLWQWAGQEKLGDGECLDLSDKIKVIERAKLIEFEQRELPAAIGQKVESAWHRAVFGIKGGEKRSGLDGATFVFRAFSKENGRASWDAWSPPPKSLADRLSTVALALGQYCESGSTQAVETALSELEQGNTR